MFDTHLNTHVHCSSRINQNTLTNYQMFMDWTLQQVLDNVTERAKNVIFAETQNEFIECDRSIV